MNFLYSSNIFIFILIYIFVYRRGTVNRQLPPQALHYVVRVEIQGVLDCLVCSRGRQKVINSNFFVLILLIVFKEATDFSQAVRWEFLDIIVVTILM